MRTALAILLLVGCGATQPGQTAPPATPPAIAVDPAAKFWRLAAMIADDVSRGGLTEDFTRDEEAIRAERQRLRVENSLSTEQSIEVDRASFALDDLRAILESMERTAEIAGEPISANELKKLGDMFRPNAVNQTVSPR